MSRTQHHSPQESLVGCLPGINLTIDCDFAGTVGRLTARIIEAGSVRRTSPLQGACRPGGLSLMLIKPHAALAIHPGHRLRAEIVEPDGLSVSAAGEPD